MFSSHGGHLTNAMYHHGKHSNQITRFTRFFSLDHAIIDYRRGVLELLKTGNKTQVFPGIGGGYWLPVFPLLTTCNVGTSRLVGWLVGWLVGCS